MRLTAKGNSTLPPNWTDAARAMPAALTCGDVVTRPLSTSFRQVRIYCNVKLEGHCRPPRAFTKRMPSAG
jgi:hypothetical protein